MADVFARIANLLGRDYVGSVSQCALLRARARTRGIGAGLRLSWCG